jgi:RNA polymerase sigma-70 factor (ECF subfamily)
VEVPKEIIKGCRKGKARCQERLYEMVAPLMYGLCLQYAGGEDDAKDIMQEGFIKVFNKIEQYSGKGSIIGWIRRIMINTALEKYRTRVRTQSMDDRNVNIEEETEEEILDTLEAEEIIKIIQKLSPQYRMVFNLYAIEGYSHKEISELIGISEGTSKSNLSRARTILQKKLAGLYEKGME